ncbi:MAG: hypothetical protein ABSF29_15660 [Tepidisphaeraceae bacterium]|jgi:hypothetical protein
MSEGVITADIPCISCGYNQRGLSPDALCPECGAPIRKSVEIINLQACGQTWLSRLQLGLKLRIAVTCYVIFRRILSIGYYLKIPELLHVSWTLSQSAPRWTLWGATIILGWLSTWLITTPTASGDLHGRQIHNSEAAPNQLSLRQMIRFLTTFSAITEIVQPLRHSDGTLMGGMFGLIQQGVWIILAFLFMLYIQKDLAVRTSQPGIALQAAILKWIRPWYAGSLLMIVTDYLIFWLNPLHRANWYASRVAFESAVDLWIAALLISLLWALPIETGDPPVPSS